jgi:hypothetical protein
MISLKDSDNGLKKRMRSGLFFAIGLFTLAARATYAQVAGTYRLTICTTPCTGSDSGVVRGSLVLFRDSVRIDTIAPTAREALGRHGYWLLRRANTANACFTLRRQQSHVDGKELYAGITDRSLTVWVSDGRTTRVGLYQSPDASYTLTGTFDGGIYSGTGQQGNCCGGTSPETFFRAVRVGDPDLGACVS